MPSLSDKLKSLGVKGGAAGIAPPPRRAHPIETVAPGRLLPTSTGDAYAVEVFYPHQHPYGRTALQPASTLQTIADWAGSREICACGPEAFTYLDIETTGLQGGTGTYAFLVGAGRFEASGFHLVQFFMRDPLEEPAQLLALEEFLAPCQTIVTYNGKSFDIPLLSTRYTAQGWKHPFGDLHHIDLLHLARRLWRDRLPSRTLGNVETFILGARRKQEDVPGWLIPQLYFDYLRSGDARPLKNVLYHNEMDVLSMAALLHHVSTMLELPDQTEPQDPSDLPGMARLFEDLGRTDEAIGLYRRSLEAGLSEDLFWSMLERLSFIYKRLGDTASAAALWEQAAQHGHLYAHEELAKFHEHHQRNYPEAMRWTEAALVLTTAPTFPPYLRKQRQAELNHRLARLQRKII